MSRKPAPKQSTKSQEEKLIVEATSWRQLFYTMQLEVAIAAAVASRTTVPYLSFLQRIHCSCDWRLELRRQLFEGNCLNINFLCTAGNCNCMAKQLFGDNCSTIDSLAGSSNHAPGESPCTCEK